MAHSTVDSEIQNPWNLSMSSISNIVIV